MTSSLENMVCVMFWALIAAGAVSLQVVRAEPPNQPQAAVTVDAAAASKPYSPMLFGGFIEHFTGQIYGGLFEPGSPLSDERGFRKDVIAAMKELKLSVVRWPGGCFASGYHWKNGVGKTRKPVPDPVWGVTDNNTFGTDEFVQWCRLVGCEPYICTNAGNGTPEEMAQWVEYCNATKGSFADLRKANGHDKPLGVKYWSIGNENYGPWEIGRKTADKWGPMVHQCAELMRSVDPTITLMAAATKKQDWSLPLLKAAGKDLDYVAVHEYWYTVSKRRPEISYKACMGFSAGPERSITGMIDILQEAGFRGKIKIAFDEWNLRHWHHPGFPRKSPVADDDKEAADFIAQRDLNAVASQYTMADALFTASFLNACLRHCEDVGMANIAPIVNTRGPLYVHPKGIVRRTTFHVLSMYANLLESRVAKFDLQPDWFAKGNKTPGPVDAVVTTDESGKRWSIAMVNRQEDQAVPCTVKLGESLLDGEFDATVLAGDSPDAFNDVEHPDRVVPEKRKARFSKGVIQLPPHSLTIVRGSAQ